MLYFQRAICRIVVVILPIWAAATLLHECASAATPDYTRADQFPVLTRNKVFKDKVQPHWFAGNSKFWYRNDLSGGRKEFMLVDTVAGTRRPAFDHAQLAAALTEKLGKATLFDRLPFDAIELSDEGAAVRFNIDAKGWKFNPDNSLTEAEPLPERRAAEAPARGRPQNRTGRGSSRRADSPDGKKTVVARDFNLCVRMKETGEKFALTTDGRKDNYYEPAVVWSPDSRRCVARQTQPGEEHKVYVVESSPGDQVQPKLHSFDYHKPGDRLPVTKPRLFDLDERRQMQVSDALFLNPWSIDDIRWSADSKQFTFLYNQRGHQVLRIVAVNAETGDAKALINEESPTFIDYAYKRFAHYADRSGEIIWMSERDGWNHLYLYDTATGDVKNQITKGEWVVRGVDRVDEERRQIWFRAGGIRREQDPYYIHFCRVNFDGTGLVVLTAGDGTHEIEYSPDRRFFLDTYSRVDLPPVVELRRTDDGALVCELEQADWSELLAAGWKVPERFVAKGRDGTTDIYGVIYRPTNFDAGKMYAVVEQIYAGPHGSFVPKKFSPMHSAQRMAEIGFVTVQIDGMGTSNRSKAFHDVCWKNLGDSGFPDRILWLRAAAAKYPYLDLTRVGIYGGSAGGQSSTRALLAHGDFYKAAVSDCGCHDNRMDKVWWNELWMGYPLGPHYAEQSNVTQAHKLTGKLMLVVGELDRNVDPASTMQVVNALVRANKDFDLVLIPGAGHGAAETPYGQRRRREFLARHLLE
jgi:dipeptidyl-peptidase 4